MGVYVFCILSVCFLWFAHEARDEQENKAEFIKIILLEVGHKQVLYRVPQAS